MKKGSPESSRKEVKVRNANENERTSKIGTEYFSLNARVEPDFIYLNPEVLSHKHKVFNSGSEPFAVKIMSTCPTRTRTTKQFLFVDSHSSVEFEMTLYERGTRSIRIDLLLVPCVGRCTLLEGWKQSPHIFFEHGYATYKYSAMPVWQPILDTMMAPLTISEQVAKLCRSTNVIPARNEKDLMINEFAILDSAFSNDIEDDFDSSNRSKKKFK